MWIEDDVFDNNDDQSITDVSKDILQGIKENDAYVDFNIPIRAIIDDLFEPSDDDSNDEWPELILVEPAIPQPNVVVPNTDSVSLDTGPQKSKRNITTHMKKVIREANRIKEKYKKQQRKKIGQLNKKIMLLLIG